MATRIHGAAAVRRKLRGLAPQVLADLQEPVRDFAATIAAEAQIAVPRGSGELAKSDFVDSEVDRRNLVTTATTGYAAPHAAYVHEGVHYGRQTEQPPKWLEQALDNKESLFAGFVGDAIRDALTKGR